MLHFNNLHQTARQSGGGENFGRLSKRLRFWVRTRVELVTYIYSCLCIIYRKTESRYTFIYCINIYYQCSPPPHLHENFFFWTVFVFEVKPSAWNSEAGASLKTLNAIQTETWIEKLWVKKGYQIHEKLKQIKRWWAWEKKGYQTENQSLPVKNWFWCYMREGSERKKKSNTNSPRACLKQRQKRY